MNSKNAQSITIKAVSIVMCAALCLPMSGCYSLKGRIEEVQYVMSEKDAPGDHYSLDDDTPIAPANKPALTEHNVPQPDVGSIGVTQNPLDVQQFPSDTLISEPAPVLPDVISSSYISAVNNLGLKFLKTLDSGYTGSFSPPMLAMLMDMMLYSANEPATAAIRSVIGTNMSITELQGNSLLLQEKLALDNIHIRLAMIFNSTKDADDIFEPVVSQKPVTGYGAEVMAFDYSMTHYIISEFNRWMNSGSDGHIKSIITTPMESAKISVLGGTCIDPLWDGTAFHDAYYTDETFNSAVSGTHTISMINTTGEFHHSTYNGGTLLAIPSNHNDLICLFGTPPAGETPAEYAAEILAGNDLHAMVASMDKSTFHIAIPRITEYNAISCTENLRQLGLGDCLDGGAGNFAKMTLPETYAGLPTISEVYAGTAVVLDETTRSSTLEPVPVVSPETAGLLTPENAVFKLDSPFFVAVIHDATQCIVSLSLINDPV